MPWRWLAVAASVVFVVILAWALVPRLYGLDAEQLVAQPLAKERFFDRAAVDCLFADGWGVLSCEEHMVDRYKQPKALWEVIAERAILVGGGREAR